MDLDDLDARKCALELRVARLRDAKDRFETHTERQSKQIREDRAEANRLMVMAKDAVKNEQVRIDTQNKALERRENSCAVREAECLRQKSETERHAAANEHRQTRLGKATSMLRREQAQLEAQRIMIQNGPEIWRQEAADCAAIVYRRELECDRREDACATRERGAKNMEKRGKREWTRIKFGLRLLGVRNNG